MKRGLILLAVAMAFFAITLRTFSEPTTILFEGPNDFSGFTISGGNTPTPPFDWAASHWDSQLG